MTSVLACGKAIIMHAGSSAARQAVFLDRDGVLNIDHGFVSSPERLELITGAAAALQACRSAGYLVFVVTNQSGVARGYFDEAAVDTLHQELRRRLAMQGALIDDVRFCPHLEDAAVPAYRRACSWRKPAPGMLLDLMAAWNIDPSRSFMIGDKPSDMAAAAAANVCGFLFKGGDLASFVAAALARMAARAAG